MSPFFILSCARSGSTSLARILDAAANGACVVEPTPNLNVETRLAMEGRLADPAGVVREQIAPRVRAGVASHGVYGEKNVTYGPFVPHLREQLDARFVLLKRDGREASAQDCRKQHRAHASTSCKKPARSPGQRLARTMACE